MKVHVTTCDRCGSDGARHWNLTATSEFGYVTFDLCPGCEAALLSPLPGASELLDALAAAHEFVREHHATRR